MQILVVVANIQVRSLKTEVEKGSTWTAVECGSVGPKILANAIENFEDTSVFGIHIYTGMDSNIFDLQYIKRETS